MESPGRNQAGFPGPVSADAGSQQRALGDLSRALAVLLGVHDALMGPAGTPSLSTLTHFLGFTMPSPRDFVSLQKSSKPPCRCTAYLHLFSLFWNEILHQIWSRPLSMSSEVALHIFGGLLSPHAVRYLWGAPRAPRSLECMVLLVDSAWLRLR